MLTRRILFDGDVQDVFFTHYVVHAPVPGRSPDALERVTAHWHLSDARDVARALSGPHGDAVRVVGVGMADDGLMATLPLDRWRGGALVEERPVRRIGGVSVDRVCWPGDLLVSIDEGAVTNARDYDINRMIRETFPEARIRLTLGCAPLGHDGLHVELVWTRDAEDAFREVSWMAGDFERRSYREVCALEYRAIVGRVLARSKLEAMCPLERDVAAQRHREALAQTLPASARAAKR